MIVVLCYFIWIEFIVMLLYFGSVVFQLARSESEVSGSTEKYFGSIGFQLVRSESV